MWRPCQGVLVVSIAFLLLMVVVSSLACEFEDEDEENATRLELHNLLANDNVRLVEYCIDVKDYSQEFWRNVGGNEWFQPWRWYRAKGTNSHRLLLLFHYYYGLLKPYLGIGTRRLDLHLTVNATGCLKDLSPLDLEKKIRHFLYYDLKNETEKLTAEFTDDIQVCSMHVGDDNGWGRLVYRCCSRDDFGHETCDDISDDVWVWTLRAFIITLTVLLFLYFPKMIPRGYYVYSFRYYPPDGQSFNLLLTSNPAKYSSAPLTTVLPTARWRKMRKLAAEVGKLQPDVIYSIKIKRVNFECGMDRLLSETSSPVGMFRTVFDSIVRCKVRHSDPLEDCCNTPLCGELCCTSCPVWHAWLRALRTILVLLLLALPALPILYASAADNLEFQELASIFDERGLKQTYNFYTGSIFGKVIVSVLGGLYLLHMVLVVADGCDDQNLARAYTELMQVTRKKARLRDRIQHSQSIIRKAVWPIKRFGILAVPTGLVLLALLPAILLLYLILTSPVPKLLWHVVRMITGKDSNHQRKKKEEMTSCRLLESVLFVVTLVAVFAVLTLGLNFLVHVFVILMVQIIVDLSFVMRFLTVIVLLLVYIRDSFRVVNNTYSSHHTTVLRHVLGIEAEDIKREADKDWEQQENKIFKIVPCSAQDPKGREGKEQEDYLKKKLFYMKNGGLRMRTRSLVLFLDKDDIPYIPKKFLFHTTTMACPGCPGRLEEAYLRAAGRFGRTVVFLLFILLVVMAYADTYYISPTSTFFAMLFTGAFPLLLRYFFLNPGSVMKVDTSTLRFQTQMDDKVESFMQSWTVEDVLVDRFILPRDYDDRYGQQSSLNTEELPPLDQDTEDRPQIEASGRSSSEPHPHGAESSRAPLPSSQPHQGGDSPKKSRGVAGHVNYMLPTPSLDMEHGDDHFQYENEALEPDPNTTHSHLRQPRLPPIGAVDTEGKNEKARQNPLPPAEREAAAPTADAMIANGVREEPKANGKLPMKNQKKLRIDLVLDISQEQVPSEYEKSVSERADTSDSMSKPPNIHWNRRSRLIKEGKRRDEYDV